jgi:hypothetical protein
MSETPVWKRTAVAVSMIWAVTLIVLAFLGIVYSENERNDRRQDEVVELCREVGGTESRQACIDSWHDEFFD